MSSTSQRESSETKQSAKVHHHFSKSSRAKSGFDVEIEILSPEIILAKVCVSGFINCATLDEKNILTHLPLDKPHIPSRELKVGHIHKVHVLNELCIKKAIGLIHMQDKVLFAPQKKPIAKIRYTIDDNPKELIVYTKK